MYSNNNHPATRRLHHSTKTPWLCFLFSLAVIFASSSLWAKEPDRVLGLTKSIQEALKASTALRSSIYGVEAATEREKGQLAEFLPKLSTGYSYTRRDTETKMAGITFSPQDRYQHTATLTQPIFRGFDLVNRYRIAGLKLDISRFELEQTRQNIMAKTKQAYFTVLRAIRILRVAEDAVRGLAAHEKVARDFYEVGMTPKNDLLEAEVALANVRQELVIAENTLQQAYAEFNTILRRPIDTPVVLEDILTYKSIAQDYDSCWETARENRAELKMADLQVAIAGKDVQLARRSYMPEINLQGNYAKEGYDAELRDNEDMLDPEYWNVVVSATWTFWEWGSTWHGVKEKLSLAAQAGEKRKEAEDNIRLEVKKAYLKLIESEKNIHTVEKAIEQGKENLRMNEERYKEQVATSTDVLDAQILLSRTEVNYYNALSAFNISKAWLWWAMGVGTAEQ
ncbi:MAG: TolC family protein [Desulfobacterales bacterium]|nr:TolC family protein [Desulfobacterales bacterium]